MIATAAMTTSRVSAGVSLKKSKSTGPPYLDTANRSGELANAGSR